MKKLILSIFASLSLMQAAIAADYSMLFDPSAMTVGQSVGEYLTVKEFCPKDSCTPAEKLKYVTAQPGRTGRLELPVSAGDNFEISFNIRSYPDGGCNNSDFTITLYLSDNTSLPINVGGCFPKVTYGDKKETPNWLSTGVNDFRLIGENGVLQMSSNDTFLDAELNLTGAVTRIVLSKIQSYGEDIYDIRTRGIQKTSLISCPTSSTSTSCPTSGNPIGTASNKLTGISTRAYVGNTPENYLYGGITVEGNVRVLVQAVGQGLIPLGVNTALDAKVEVYTFPDRRLVASNDNWQDGSDAAALQQNGHAPVSPLDAAMYVNLTTGSYTIDVKPSGYGNPGVGLVSAYEVQ